MKESFARGEGDYLPLGSCTLMGALSGSLLAGPLGALVCGGIGAYVDVKDKRRGKK